MIGLLSPYDDRNITSANQLMDWRWKHHLAEHNNPSHLLGILCNKVPGKNNKKVPGNEKSVWNKVSGNNNSNKIYGTNNNDNNENYKIKCLAIQVSFHFSLLSFVHAL